MNLKWYCWLGIAGALFTIIYVANYLSLTQAFYDQNEKQRTAMAQQESLRYQQQINEACKDKNDNDILNGNMKRLDGSEVPVCILCKKSGAQFIDCNQVSPNQNGIVNQQGWGAGTK